MSSKFKLIFGETIKGLRKLFLEVMGIFFITLTVFGIASVVDEYRKYLNAPEQGVLRLSMSLLFSAVMVISALHSFWKARKIR